MVSGGAILACSAGRWQPPIAAISSNMCYTPRRRQGGHSGRSAIGQRMTASKIALHHIGGRWGNHPFPRLPAFAGDFVEVLYEADTDAIAAIKQAGKERPNEQIVIPA